MEACRINHSTFLGNFSHLRSNGQKRNACFIYSSLYQYDGQVDIIQVLNTAQYNKPLCQDHVLTRTQKHRIMVGVIITSQGAVARGPGKRGNTTTVLSNSIAVLLAKLLFGGLEVHIVCV